METKNKLMRKMIQQKVKNDLKIQISNKHESAKWKQNSIEQEKRELEVHV